MGNSIYYTTTLGIMVKWKSKGSPMFRVFDFWTTVVIVAVAPILCGLIKFFLDDQRENPRSYIMDVYQSKFLLDSGQTNSLLSRLLQWSYNFVFGIVIIAVYAAFFVSIMNDDKTFGGIKSEKDLKGKKVFTLDNGAYEQVVKRFAGIPILFNLYNTPDDAVTLFQARDDVHFMIYSTPVIQIQTLKHCNLYQALDNLQSLSIQAGFTLKVLDQYIRQIDIASINATGEKTYQQYFKGYLSQMKEEKCQGKENMDKEVLSFYDIKEAFYVIATAFALGIIIFFLSRSIGTRVRYWQQDNLSGRSYLILFDKITAVTTRFLVDSMPRIHQITKPKNADYFICIRKLWNKQTLERLYQRVNEEYNQSLKTISEKERPCFSAFEVGIHGKIIRSKSEEKKRILQRRLDRAAIRRLWIYLLFFFVIPYKRYKR
eukprot:TRINITY_DN5544_c0_g3_i3.p1 TRINITY_DN5544_c0_g3~~TRINITY_DN5544_c0_g3_i3.p1  ORF type:complete len:429 (+),score=35.52 TRINITY_DN5544_c0_g3_i3:49-1335(+)